MFGFFDGRHSSDIVVLATENRRALRAVMDPDAGAVAVVVESKCEMERGRRYGPEL
jgi:hypothetical protein